MTNIGIGKIEKIWTMDIPNHDARGCEIMTWPEAALVINFSECKDE